MKKGGKKGRKRKEKDLTPDRTTESLFEELVLNGEEQNQGILMNLSPYIVNYITMY